MSNLFKLAGAAVFLLGAAIAGAQTFRGEIKGSVQDASGAAISEAIVQAVHTGTGFTRSTVSSPTGEFSMPDMPLGVYTLSAKKEGFQSQESSVEVVVSRVSSAAFRLPVSTQSATVEVSAAVVDIETQSTTLTGIVNTKPVSDLPMNGRDFRQMLKLSPGVNPANSSVNGNRTRGNNFQIDGAGQQRWLSECLGGEPGRRRGHRRNIASGGGDRSVFGCHRTEARRWAATAAAW